MTPQVNLRRGNALELLKYVAQERLCTLAVHPLEMVSALSGGIDRPTAFYRDFTCSELVRIDDLDVRLVVSDPQKAEMTSLVGILKLPEGMTSANKFAFVVTLGGDLLVAAETESAIHADGMVQIYGAEPNLVLVARRDIDRFHAGETGVFVKGLAIRTLWVEERGQDGVWRKSDRPLTLPLSAVESINVSD